VLADRCRRDLLYHLAGVEVADVETLVDVVASGADDPDRDRMRMELEHNHLPRLADVGAIEYDRRTDVVRCRDLPSLLEPLVDTCREAETGD
jgi:hypothetical protein